MKRFFEWVTWFVEGIRLSRLISALILLTVIAAPSFNLDLLAHPSVRAIVLISIVFHWIRIGQMEQKLHKFEQATSLFAHMADVVGSINRDVSQLRAKETAYRGAIVIANEDTKRQEDIAAIREQMNETLVEESDRKLRAARWSR